MSIQTKKTLDLALLMQYPGYLAVVRGPGAQRSIATARPTAAKASGRTVTITLDPPAEYNQAVTLSYYPDNATADSSVRDTGGNLANGFTGFQVRNDTPERPHVDDIAFAGAGEDLRGRRQGGDRRDLLGGRHSDRPTDARP